jgi:uncharacterized SAM-binding protein YcdF (DUF218 family)
MRRLFNLIFQLVAATVFIFLGTAAWIVFDGLSDSGQKTDVALVTGHAESAQGTSEPVLDHVVQLYNQGEFPFIIETEPTGGPNHDGSGGIAAYLESKGIPSSAIIEAHWSGTTQGNAREVAQIMKSHQFQSVMIIADYYQITRTKLALTHEGIVDIEKAHVGKLRKEDAFKIGREVVALYDYIGKIYLLPAAEKVQKEAQVGMDKAKTEAEKAKGKVDKSLDSMVK